ncbi:hypothetical protein M407DRAFT_14844 [Tulasnella calospora MUT 4182]|uniref:Malate dehydrogenase n=1 Tax=Tulasnella calospora MUT 4182 TaxID=1051891 RepID=A0A0C3QBB8_9AGAM|nr:hypothetical protein M407DRAFT_14844 [Tulasnella calospora MUT 4182]
MVKAVVLGAAGGIGQPLSLLLKINPKVTELALYDIVATPGVAADLSHIATPAKVKGYLPKDEDALKKTLSGADIVVIPAGVPRKPGINAGICKGLAEGIAEHCPKAFVLVISNPVNSTVPIFAEVLKKAGVFDPKRLFGVTTLDVVRASTFVAEILDDLSLAPTVTVPVVGGHSGVTILPLLSQSEPPLPSSVSEKDIEELTKRIQFGGDEVVKAKDGAGSATLSMAQAGYQFANLIIEAIKGKKGIITPSYVNLAADAAGGEAIKKELGAEVEYFSSRVELGPNGVERILPLGNINEYEKGLVKAALPELTTNITNGVSFIAAPKL